METINADQARKMIADQGIELVIADGRDITAAFDVADIEDADVFVVEPNSPLQDFIRCGDVGIYFKA